MSLSFRMTIKRDFIDPALFIASYAMPAVIDPSPITAMQLLFSEAKSLATANPRAAEIEVAACAAPKGSYSLSDLLVKPERPFPWRKVRI